MAYTAARVLIDYAPISEQVLAEQSIIRAVSNKDIMGSISKGEQLKVYVNALGTIANYVPGTGVAKSDDGSSYVTLNNLKDRAINEIMDGVTVDKAYDNMAHVVARFTAAVAAFGEDIDTSGFLKMEADGTELVAAAGDKPVVGTIYTDVLALKLGLDNAKAPQSGRSLIISPEMHNLMLQTDSKVFLAHNRADQIQSSGWVGDLLGFSVYVTTLLPTGTNIIALQERGFAHTDDWKSDVRIQSLDGSGTYIGDSAIQGRMAYNSGAVRPTLIQVNNGAA